MVRACGLAPLAFACWVPSCCGPASELETPVGDRDRVQRQVIVPLDRTSESLEPVGATAKSLAGLFGVASLVVTGKLELVSQIDQHHEMTIRIGDAGVLVGGAGLRVPKSEAQRVRSLAGRIVTAGVHERSTMGWKFVVGDSYRLCLAAEEDMRPLVITRQRLEENKLWFSDTLVMDTGVWRRFLARLPTEERASITEEVKKLLRADRRALAGDILSWFSQTHDAELDALPDLWLGQLGLFGKLEPVPGWGHFDDANDLATVVAEFALGLSPTTLVEVRWEGLDRCRRLWILIKLLQSVDSR